MTRIVAIAGLAGSGKTTLADALVERLGWARLSIDSERAGGGDWHTLISRLDYARQPTLIESVILPAAYKRALCHHDARLIHACCDDDVRLQRLQAREQDIYDQDYEPTYQWRPTFRVDTTTPTADETITQLAEWCAAPAPRGYSHGRMQRAGAPDRARAELGG